MFQQRKKICKGDQNMIKQIKDQIETEVSNNLIKEQQKEVQKNQQQIQSSDEKILKQQKQVSFDQLERYKDTDSTPYICKDYLENGFCTWGISCLYAHIRNADLKWTKEKQEQKIEKIQKSSTQQKQHQQNCDLCQKHKEKDEGYYILNCQHIYDYNCLNKIKQQKQCPTCKAAIKYINKIK